MLMFVTNYFYLTTKISNYYENKISIMEIFARADGNDDCVERWRIDRDHHRKQ